MRKTWQRMIREPNESCKREQHETVRISMLGGRVVDGNHRLGVFATVVGGHVRDEMVLRVGCGLGSHLVTWASCGGSFHLPLHTLVHAL